MSTTDHTREALAETILSARWPDGGPIEHLTRKTTTFVADAILGSDWLAAHDAALVEGRDVEIARLREQSTSAWAERMIMNVHDMARQRDEARAALAAERERIGAAIEGDKNDPHCAPAFIRRERAARIARSSTDGGDTDG